MIRIKIKIKSTNGETFTNIEEVDDEYVVSRANTHFINLIQANVIKSHMEEIDSVNVIAYFGEL